MSAREVISRILRDMDLLEAQVKTSTILFAMEDAGYRIIAPGELDSETLEAAAHTADEQDDVVLAVEAIRNLRSAG